MRVGAVGGAEGKLGKDSRIFSLLTGIYMRIVV